MTFLINVYFVKMHNLFIWMLYVKKSYPSNIFLETQIWTRNFNFEISLKSVKKVSNKNN